jgi:hypothetical protein
MGSTQYVLLLHLVETMAPVSCFATSSFAAFPFSELNRIDYQGLFESKAVMSNTFQHIIILYYAVSLRAYSA